MGEFWLPVMGQASLGYQLDLLKAATARLHLDSPGQFLVGTGEIMAVPRLEAGSILPDRNQPELVGGSFGTQHLHPHEAGLIIHPVRTGPKGIGNPTFLAFLYPETTHGYKQTNSPNGGMSDQCIPLGRQAKGETPYAWL